MPVNGFDTTAVIDNLLPSLHAAVRADLSPWSEGDLVQWMDEGLKRLARLVALFVVRDTGTSTAAGVATYALPANHVATLHVSVNGVTLRSGNMAELEARDPAFRTMAGIPDHWYEDLIGLATLGLTPVPNTAQTIGTVYASWPDALDVAKTQTMVSAPSPLKGYLAMQVLAEAYGREGDMEMPDVAQHCKARMRMYEQIWLTGYGGI